VKGIWLIARRELKAYVRSPLGYALAAAVLLGEGIWFMAKGMGGADAKRLSAQVLFECFFALSGGTALAAWLMAARSMAFDAEHGQMVLLKTSPVSDRAVVLGKYLGVLTVLAVLTLLSMYMPALIFVNGKVSIGHILIGYAGVYLFGAAVAAIGVFGSALAKNQVVAFILSGTMVLVLILMWMVARRTEPPVSDFLDGLALHHMHQRDFMNGVLKLQNVAYYVAVAFCFLLAAIKTQEARRWR
jgi:gliding motility-associated transport system permease protein